MLIACQSDVYIWTCSGATGRLGHHEAADAAACCQAPRCTDPGRCIQQGRGCEALAQLVSVLRYSCQAAAYECSLWLQRQQTAEAAAGRPSGAPNGAPAPVATYAPQSALALKAWCHVLVLGCSGGLPACTLAAAAASRIAGVGCVKCGSRNTALSCTALGRSHAVWHFPAAVVAGAWFCQPKSKTEAEPSQRAGPAPMFPRLMAPSAGPATLRRGVSAPAHQRMCPASGRRQPDPARHKAGRAACPLPPLPRRTWLGMKLRQELPLLRPRCRHAASTWLPLVHVSRLGQIVCWAGLYGPPTAAGLREQGCRGMCVGQA